ncbi:MAG: GntR family transcriptional regulator [Pseudonocardiaceae bacterium]
MTGGQVPRIDRASGVPAYRQVADELRKRIREGTYAPGAQLPSERELSELFSTSRVTIRQAIAELRTEGLIVAEHGRGLFVRPQRDVQRLSRGRLSTAERQAGRGTFLTDATHRGFTPRVEVEIRHEPTDGRTAQFLDLDQHTDVVVRDRLMFADDRPVQIAISRLPSDLVQGTAIEQDDTGPGGIYARLDELGHGPTHFTEIVSARMPSPEESSALQLSGGTPVLLITRIAYDSTNRPVELNDMVLAADHYELVYELPAE